MEIRAGILPSRSFALVALSIAVVAALIFMATQVSPDKDMLAQGEITVTKTLRPNTPSTIAVEDSDGDGLYDWEEALWKTNPNLKDSDGDGVDDAKEVELFIAYGKERAAAARAKKQEPTHPEDLTQTDIVARDLFSKFSTLQFAGVGSQESLNDIVNSVGSGVLESNAPVQKYSTASINTVDTNTLTLKAYVNDLGLIISEHPIDANSELEILQSIVISEDKNALSRFSNISKEYLVIVSKMSFIQVPDELATTHVSMMNNLATLSNSFSSIELIFTDPIAALGGVSNVGTTLPLLSENIFTMNITLAEHGVHIEPGDIGYIFQG